MSVEPEDAELAVAVFIEPCNDGEFSSAIRTKIVNRRCCVPQNLRECSRVGNDSAQISHAFTNLTIGSQRCGHFDRVGDQGTQSWYRVC